MTVPYTSETLPAACASFTAPQEGRIPFMYRDNAKAGNVTVGCGHLIQNVNVACVEFDSYLTEMQPQFDAVAGAPAGKAAGFYAQFSTLRLTDARIDALLESDLAEHIGNCARIVPGFWQLPGPVQVATVDIDFNVEGGIRTFPHYLAAVAAGDWQEAAVQSNRPQLPARSAATKALILSAVQS